MVIHPWLGFRIATRLSSSLLPPRLVRLCFVPRSKGFVCLKRGPRSLRILIASSSDNKLCVCPAVERVQAGINCGNGTTAVEIHVNNVLVLQHDTLFPFH